MITKPMLAGTITDMSKLRYPLAGTAKLDGIRALKPEDMLVSRTFKPIPNHHIRGLLSKILPTGSDGEALSGCNFQDCTHAVMNQDEISDNFWYAWFDLLLKDPARGYLHRMDDLRHAHMKLLVEGLLGVAKLHPWYPKIINNETELLEYEQWCLCAGYEGVILRDPNGPYKFGRSTEKEGFLLKLKRFKDSEGEVIGFVEQMHNENEKKKDAFGRGKRSSHKDNKTGKGTLGALMVRDIHTGLEFKMSGFSAELAQEIWDNQKKYLGRLAKYKYFDYGVKELPRHPNFQEFVGFRHRDDL